MARTNNGGRGRGRGSRGSSPGRTTGRGKKGENIVFNAPARNAGKEFFQSFGITTTLPSTSNKGNNEQRSPFEGGSQLKKPAPFSKIELPLDLLHLHHLQLLKPHVHF